MHNIPQSVSLIRPLTFLCWTLIVRLMSGHRLNEWCRELCVMRLCLSKRKNEPGFRMFNWDTNWWVKNEDMRVFFLSYKNRTIDGLWMGLLVCCQLPLWSKYKRWILIVFLRTWVFIQCQWFDLIGPIIYSILGWIYAKLMVFALACYASISSYLKAALYWSTATGVAINF